MKFLARETGGRVGIENTKGIVNIKSVKRAKAAMVLFIAPLGLVVIAIVSGLRLGEKLNVGFLWLSVIAVAAYAIETYELRKSSENQVALQRDLMMNEFLPIIVPSGEGFITASKLELNVVNCGKGVAKDVHVRIGTTTIARSITILNDSLPVTLRADQNVEKIQAATKNGKAKEISVDIIYKDIYERETSTVGLKFKHQTGKNTRYILRRTGWQYKNPDPNT